MMKRGYCFKHFIIPAFLALFLTSCGSTGVIDSGKSSTSGTLPENNVKNDMKPDYSLVSFPLKNKITVSALYYDFGRTMDKMVDQEIEKKTNIKINYELIPPAEYFRRLEIRLSCGEVPDLITTNVNFAARYGSMGMFADVMPYLNNMPHLQKWVDKYPNIVDEIVTGDNKLYGVEIFNARGDIPRAFIYREDIFKKNGIEEPKTIQDVYDDLVKLKKLYPDSLPVINRWGANNIIDKMLNLYRTHSDFYLDNNDLTYKYGPAEENYKRAIAMLNKFFKAKLIDPDFATTSDAEFFDKIASGKALFLFGEYTGTIDDKTNILNKAKMLNPDFSLKVMLPPSTEAGPGLVCPQYPTSQGGIVASISSKSKYVRELVSLQDYQLSDEIMQLASWGIEGDTFIQKGNNKEFTAKIKTDTSPGGTIDPLSIGLDGRSGFWIPLNFDIGHQNLPDTIKKLYEASDKICFWDGHPLRFTKAEEEEINSVMDPINTYIHDSLIMFITGKYNMQADWDDFQNRLDQMGYKKVLNIYRNKYESLPAEKKGLNKDIGVK